MHTAHYGTHTITILGLKLWKLVPDEIKNASSLSVFKSRINTCTIALCKSEIDQNPDNVLPYQVTNGSTQRKIVTFIYTIYYVSRAIRQRN